jgi:hypothetical protein
LQLATRTEVGSEFSARLYLKTDSYNPSGEITTSNDQIWYEIDGLLTASAVQFLPGTIVEMTADFITTGPIRLLTQTVQSSKILQEDDGEIRLEQNATASLLQEGEPN